MSAPYNPNTDLHVERGAGLYLSRHFDISQCRMGPPVPIPTAQRIGRARHLAARCVVGYIERRSRSLRDVAAGSSSVGLLTSSTARRRWATAAWRRLRAVSSATVTRSGEYAGCFSKRYLKSLPRRQYWRGSGTTCHDRSQCREGEARE